MIESEGVTAIPQKPWKAVLATLALFVALPAFLPGVVDAKDEIVFAIGASQPLGDTESFVDVGTTYELRWRHWNRGNSAFELVGGFAQYAAQGEIQSTINGFEALVREKNQLGQLQGTSDGNGKVIAEFGTLDVYSLTANYIYRFMRRSRISPTVGFGGGGYYWKMPFRVKFRDVPSFGEQRPWLPIGDPNNSTVYAFDFDEQVLDYTKTQVAGGLSAALGLDMRLTNSLLIGGDARAHIIFSSGQGNLEEGADDQSYLDNMTFLYLQGWLSYRF